MPFALSGHSAKSNGRLQKMEIYLARHGETDWNKEMRLQGWADISLNERGREEARDLAKKLSGIHFDAAWCSDLDRAAETAQIVLEGHGISPVVDPRLREMGFGPIEGQLYGDARTDPSLPLHELFIHPDKYQPPFGGETLDFVTGRLDAFRASELDRLYGEKPDATALVVAHGIFVRNAVTIAGGFSYDNFWKLPIGNCAVVRLGYDGKRLSLIEMDGLVKEWLV